MQAGRKIKFRAWDEQRKTMYNGEALDVYDYLVAGLSNGAMFIAAYDPEWRELPIMQFTGLRDKNDKEIYEGDIVKFLYNSTPQTEYKGTVKWDNDGLSWSFSGLLIEPTPRKTMEIIGNIYENPELLEVGK